MKGPSGLDLDEQGRKSRGPCHYCHSRVWTLPETWRELLQKAEARAPPHTCQADGGTGPRDRAAHAVPLAELGEPPEWGRPCAPGPAEQPRWA